MKRICSPCLAIKLTTAALLGAIYLSGEVFAGSACCDTEKTATPSLQTKLDNRADNFAATAPEPLKQTFAKGIEHVKKSEAMKTAKRTGDQAPGFTLPHATGEEITLPTLRKDGPVVLIWYRGGWCPYCNMQLDAMQEVLPQLKEAGATLVAISPEAPDKALTTQEKNELDFYVLSDLGNRVAKDYGIVYTLDDATHEIYEKRLKLSEYNKDKSGQLPLTVAYVIDQDGAIRWDFVDGDYKKRAEPSAILEAVLALDSTPAEPAS